jgi:hypothetical protein
MRRELLVAVGLGLAIAIAALTGVLWFNKDAHLRLDGVVQKVRVQALDEACAVVADFRVTNPSGVPFVVRTVRLVLTDAGGRQLEGGIVADVDAKRFFDFYTELGPKYNASLATREKIAASQTVDRMVAARFEMPAIAALGRKNVKIVIEDVDGAVAEVWEGMPDGR